MKDDNVRGKEDGQMWEENCGRLSLFPCLELSTGPSVPYFSCQYLLFVATN